MIDTLIGEMNQQGWAVSLRQHPDLREHWECQLSRPAAMVTNGILRHVCFGAGPSPCQAIYAALDAEVEVLAPTGLPTTEPAIDLRALLGLKPTYVLPTITRR